MLPNSFSVKPTFENLMTIGFVKGKIVIVFLKFDPEPFTWRNKHELVVFGSRMLSLKICPFYLMWSKITLKQIGSQVPALDNLSVVKMIGVYKYNLLQETWLSFKLETCQYFMIYFVSVILRLQDLFQVQALDGLKLFI